MSRVRELAKSGDVATHGYEKDNKNIVAGDNRRLLQNQMNNIRKLFTTDHLIFLSVCFRVRVRGCDRQKRETNALMADRVSDGDVVRTVSTPIIIPLFTCETPGCQQ